jgi:putative hemolysin
VVSLVGCPVANGLSCLSKDQPTVSTVSSRAGLARAAGRSRRGPPLRHADQLAPTHGRRCSDAGDASRRFLASLPRSASASDVRWASCRTALRGMAQRRSRHDRPAALASTARAACRAFGGETCPKRAAQGSEKSRGGRPGTGGANHPGGANRRRCFRAVPHSWRELGLRAPEKSRCGHGGRASA